MIGIVLVRLYDVTTLCGLHRMLPSGIPGLNSEFFVVWNKTGLLRKKIENVDGSGAAAVSRVYISKFKGKISTSFVAEAQLIKNNESNKLQKKPSSLKI